MIDARSPFETSREVYDTNDHQWLIDFYLSNLRRPGRRRYGGAADGTTATGTAVTHDLSGWQDPESGSQEWIDPETGLPWLDPAS